MRSIALAAFMLAAVPAIAAEPRWTPAPVPNIGAGDTVQPAARAGNTSSEHDAPFSAIPTDSVAAGGATSSNKYNGVGTPNPSPR